MVIGFNKQFPDKIIAGTKLHTIREDSKDRWKVGVCMHMATGVRSKKYNCFKQDICKGTQQIVIEYRIESIEEILSTEILVSIDNQYFYDNLTSDSKTIERMKKLALNDGFDSIDDFFDWFYTDFTGKLIHWTDLRY